ncbi:putative integral membrane protein [Streptomyces malaysiensis]|uniref:Putative integral membrane protein n=1 Tax=Streptomyces malaysiensis TaxID=92644 RepID=A0A7X5WWI9_STRMQ|nr:putative integral membrane protein [Streptomyces malaysiensis]
MAGLLWAVFSVPLVTLPLSTVGLLTLADAWARGERPSVWPVFWGGFTRRPLRALAVGWPLLLAGGILVLNLAYVLHTRYLPLRTPVLMCTVVLALGYALTGAFALPLVAVTGDRPLTLFRNAVLLAAGSLRQTAAIWTAVAVAAVATALLPPLLPLCAALTASYMARLTRQAILRLKQFRSTRITSSESG